MGYYNGNGVVTGGGKVIRPMDSVVSGGTLIRERLDITSVRVKNGVSLATAEAATPSESLRCQDVTCGTAYWATPQASGRSVNYAHQQIGGSNLYTLVETTSTFQVRLAYRSGAGVLSVGEWAPLP